MLFNRLFAFVGLCLAVSSSAVAAEDGPELRSDLNEQVVMLQVKPGVFGYSLQTTLFSPPGNGPFPLVVINHGSSGFPRYEPRARYTVLVQELLKRGYMVALPMRAGFAGSGGTVKEVRLDNVSVIAIDQARDIRRAIEALQQDPRVRADQIMVFGQSFGGLASVALAQDPPPGVRLIANFAGGMRPLREGASSGAWEHDLARGFATLAPKPEVTQVPHYWFYGENDSVFPLQVIEKAVAAYREQGGKIEFVKFGPFQPDAHGMFGTLRGFEMVWWPKLAPVLADMGLPTEVRHPQIGRKMPPPASGFAEFTDVNKVPTSDGCREIYSKVLHAPFPRAFAIDGQGACGGWADYEDAEWHALRNCRQFSKQPQQCRLYLVDEVVVWAPDNG